MNFNGWFDLPWDVPCTIVGFFVENRLGRAQRLPSAGFISAGPQNLSQKYLL